MFAGPNGSGKSTLNGLLPDKLLGIYLNADEIERTIRKRGFFDASAFGIASTGEEIVRFLRESALLAEAGMREGIDRIGIQGNRLEFGPETVNAYHASVLSDFVRQRLLEKRESFTMETVMSHRSLPG